jgi:hypothetical protein
VLCRFNDHQLFLGFVVHLLWFPLLPDHLLQLLHLLTNRQLQFMLARLLQQWTMNFSFHFSVFVALSRVGSVRRIQVVESLYHLAFVSSNLPKASFVQRGCSIN